MKCSHCGYELTKLTNFCPACGTKLSDGQKAELSSQKHPAKRLKAILWTILATLLAVALFVLLSSDMTDTVKEQLKEIKEGKLSEAYHNYTSKAFQSATSLESFTEFMKTYPGLANSNSVRFVDRKESDNTGELRALVETNDGIEVPVHYKLVYEGDKWRILNIKVERPSQNQPDEKATAPKQPPKVAAVKKESVFDSKPIEKAINDQMSAIRTGNFKQAYDDYTSKDFKKFTPFSEFETFLKTQPGFFDNSTVDIGDLSIDNNIVSFYVNLGSQNGKETKVEYDLVYEDNAWKVVHLDMIENRPVVNNNSGTAPGTSQIKFEKFVVGTSIDKEGLVVSPDDHIHPNSGEIYLNVHTSNAKKGTKVEVVFEHVDSGSKVNPVYIDIPEDGESILSFSFSPPKEGWPEGDYRFLVTASTGDLSSFDFKIK